jgi:nucleoside-diphosphate-sugar epimerase
VAEPVLVTGATGFIGRATVECLKNDQREIVALGSADGDIADAGTLDPFRAHAFACVIHLAGRNYVPESWRNTAAFMRANLEGTIRVLELCREKRVPLVFVSAYVYGLVSGKPISEEELPAPRNPYAESKYLAEQACRSFFDSYGVPVTVLRPFNVYGPHQDERFLVPTIIRQVVQRKTIEVLDLGPRRDWVFVDDVAEAIVAASRRKTGYSVYNIGSGASVSVEELIQRIQEVARTELPVRSRNQPRAQEIDDTVADIGKAARELGWQPRTPLREGLQRCVEAMDTR